MKRLTLVRHAKSSWKDLSQPDAVRPLNGRGKRDAPEMGLRFAQRYPDLDYVMITSPAQRAMSTARLFAEAAGYVQENIVVDDRVYIADVSQLNDIAAGFDEAWGHVVLVGHNPGFTDFVNTATKHFIENIPTAGIAELQYNVDSWDGLETVQAVLAELDTPKRTHT